MFLTRGSTRYTPILNMEELINILKSQKEIFFILLGWALGLSSSIILEKYKKRLIKNEIKIGIKNELHEFRLRLAATNLHLTTDRKDITLDYAKWIKPYYKILFETDIYDYMRKGPQIAKPITHLSDQEFLKCLIISKELGKNKLLITTPTFPKFRLTYLESNYNSIAYFGESISLNISQLKREIDNLNESIDDVRFYHNKTFETLSDNNRLIVEHNITDNIESLIRETKHLITLSGKIINKLG